MIKELDEKYHNLALDSLHSGLAGYEVLGQRDTTEANVTEILSAFGYSGNILRTNQESDHIRMVAETVFVTCIRLARCLFFPDEGRTIVLNGDEHVLDAEAQWNVLRRNISHLQLMVQNS
ncbi:hypothetical protein [Marinobacter sp.]|uniref:hypothetical protein n=1 Tax=Marinobacter sp. TaxID=50741 RepID=UPI003A8CCE22